jgi:hypothetical protein
MTYINISDLITDAVKPRAEELSKSRTVLPTNGTKNNSGRT